MYKHPTAVRLCKSRKLHALLNFVGLPRRVPPAKVWIVAGAPRSGTTWLAENLSGQIGAKMLDEPLHLGRYPSLADRPGISWRVALSESDVHADLYEHLQRAFEGRVPGLYTFPHKNLIRQLVAYVVGSSLVVKLVRSGQMLPWLGNNFGAIAGMVYTFRHPCAVIASQLDYKYGQAWRDNPTPALSPQLEDVLPGQVVNGIRKTLNGEGSVVESLAVQWCLDNYLPLVQGIPFSNAVRTTYENLLMDREQEMGKIAGALKLDLDVHGASPSKPSHSVSKDLLKPTAQLEKWKSKLDGSQVDAILRIVNLFGITLYDRSCLPTYDLI